MLAGADFPPPIGFIWVVLLISMLDFMNYVIDSEVLVLNELQPDLKYASIAGACLTTKRVEEITIA